MKVCFTFVKKFRLPNEYMETQKFISELLKLGMPEEKIQELMESGKVVWEKPEVDNVTTFAAEIIG